MPERPPDYAPGLAGVARVLPRGLGLRVAYRPQRALMALAGRLGGSSSLEVTPIGPGCSVRIQRPADVTTPAPALLWIHGGGRVMGTAAQDDAFLARLGREVGCAVVAVEHRLAPEHPHPIPVEDCLDALAWLADQPWADSNRLAVGGASAGGGFAASVAQLAHDRGTAALVLQALVYPMLDDRTGRAHAVMGMRMWSGWDNERAWELYLGSMERDSPDPVSPARRQDLSGLPRAWIGVGTCDLFLGESRRYAEALREAGVPVVLHEAAGAFHAFDQLRPEAEVSRAFHASLFYALCEAFGTLDRPTAPA